MKSSVCSALLWGSITLLAVFANAPQAQSETAEAFAEALFETVVNRQFPAATVLMLRATDGSVWVSAEDLKRWRIAAPSMTAHEHRGEKFYPLRAIEGLDIRLDEARQTLAIEVPAQRFAETVLTTERRARAPLATPAPGGFFNYDLAWTKSSSESAALGGVFEGGFFSRHGVLVSSFAGEDSDAARRFTRLETTFTHDRPDEMRSLRAGDAVTRSGTWGRPVRFGGLQFGTNFATNPAFIRTPTLAAQGQTSLPSVVDVYVNNALVSRRDVPPGPFSIINIPAVSGSGNVNLVVRDLLGRQQVISQPFYASPSLLARGLADYSVEAGAERKNFGLASDDYANRFVAGTYRYGLTDSLTGEVHTEIDRDVRALGMGGDYIAPFSTIFSAYAAGSQSDAGTGHLFIAGFERQQRSFSVAARSQWASSAFRQLGAPVSEPPPAQLLTVNAGVFLGEWGSFGIALVRQKHREAATTDVISATYSIGVSRYAFLSLSATRSLGNEASTLTSIFLTVPLGRQTTASAGFSTNRSASGGTQRETNLSLQQNLPAGEGYGYRLQLRDEGQHQASVAYQTNFGIYSAEEAHAGGRTAVRLNAAGGLGYLGGHLFASRPLTDSFALIHVPGFANVRVLRDNQPEARTDANGYAVLPRLRPYDHNRVSLDAKGLPLDAKIDSLRIEAAPFFRSGALLTFPVSRVRGATLRLLLEDGSFMPAGAVVRLNEADETFPVAYQGEAYVTGWKDQNTLRATWRGQSCDVAVPFPTISEIQPDLGEHVCKGVAR